ncbi:hypothetical protein B296_00001493 [Ensete ventricosum]|uniref:EndoU domain-containing protein n=1 Tax=Ensete ventricosum TaxID=4639 RepID=A0A427AXN8_ENSVE|nr:hypothetical protein B296_00001493 [Ensete ventricosum]
MEGLVKGLMKVALDAVAGGGDDYDNARRSPSPSREERSRSTWAQVPSYSRLIVLGHTTHLACCIWIRVLIAVLVRGSWQAPAETWSAFKRHPDEQQYMDHAKNSVNVEPTREELDDLSEACSRLWELDLNRLVPGKDYEIDCGGGKKVYQKGDMASECLFSWLNDDILRRPTFSRFCSLLDNYNPDEGCKEVVTSEEKHEQTAFIEEISRTAPMKYLYHYLVSKEIISDNYEHFKRMMCGLWFDLYGRGGVSGSSSAFEHVFVGEIKRREEKEVSGFHNWIQAGFFQVLCVLFVLRG